MKEHQQSKSRIATAAIEDQFPSCFYLSRLYSLSQTSLEAPRRETEEVSCHTAITTRYLTMYRRQTKNIHKIGPTTHRGTRIRVTCRSTHVQAENEGGLHPSHLLPPFSGRVPIILPPSITTGTITIGTSLVTRLRGSGMNTTFAQKIECM